MKNKSLAGHPNPGSDAALARGCLCAVMDNGHGHGYMGQPGVFVVTVGCPLHSAVGIAGETKCAPKK